MGLTERVRDGALSARERRVAELLLADPSRIAFGTVASVAADAGVGTSTVMRFATRIGYEGFRDLQQAVRAELDGRLRTATHRVRRPAAADPVQRALEVESANVHESLARVDPDVLAGAVDRLARAERVAVLAGDAARGVAADLSGQLGMLRAAVELVDVGTIALGRALSWLDRGDVLVVLDTARYEASVAAATEHAAAAGVPVLAVTDSHVSPIATVATWSFQVLDAGIGPFDSFVGALALANLLVAGVTARLGRRAVRHIDRLEAEWSAARVLRPAD